MDIRRWIVMVAALVPMLGVAAPASAANEAIGIVDNSFDPEGLEVGTADTVTWTNDGAIDHTVTADDGSFDSGTLEPGDSFVVESLPAGTIRYHCTIHGGPDGEGMSGVLFVQDGISGGDAADADTPARALATTGSGSLPPAAFALLALSIVALGVYLSRYERIVYPERFG